MGHEYLRDFLGKAEKLGFVQDGFDGRGHPILVNDACGIRTSVAFSPSDWRSEKNALARLERLTGQKLQRENTGKYRHRRVTQANLRATEHEQQCCSTVEAMVREASDLRTEFRRLTAACDRTAVDAARKVIARYSELEKQCERMYRVIPAITDFGA